MHSPNTALVVLLLSTFACPRAAAQGVTATADAISPLQVSTSFSNHSAPAGTILTSGFTVATSRNLPGGWGGFARATHAVTTTDGAITYRVDHGCSVSESSNFGWAACGSAATPQVTRLTLNSPQSTRGTVTIVATGSSWQSIAAGATGFVRSVEVDIGNDGTTEWSTTAIAGGSHRQRVVVAGTLEIRVSAHGATNLFPNQSLATVSWFTSFEIRFEPLLAGCQVRNGNGINPVACSCATLPVIGTTWSIAIASDPKTLQTFAFVGGASVSVPFPPFGELLLAPPWIPIPGTAVHPVVLPNAPALIGATLSVQGARLNAVGPALALELTNAVDAVLGV